DCHGLARAAPLEQARRAREEAQLFYCGRYLVGGHQRLWLAVAAALGVDEALRVLLERVGDVQEREAALGRCGRPPAVEGGLRGADGVVDVGRARSGSRPVGLTRARLDERGGRGVSGI